METCHVDIWWGKKWGDYYINTENNKLCKAGSSKGFGNGHYLQIHKE